MRVLLVQGHTAEAHACSVILGTTGAMVDHVRTVRDALMYLQTYEYDFIVFARAMPDMDGCDAIRRFRAQGFTTPVLMLADYTTGKSRAEALRIGADDLLT